MYTARVTFLHVQCVNFYKNDTYSSAFYVIKSKAGNLEMSTLRRHKRMCTKRPLESYLVAYRLTKANP